MEVQYIYIDRWHRGDVNTAIQQYKQQRIMQRVFFMYRLMHNIFMNLSVVARMLLKCGHAEDLRSKDSRVSLEPLHE